MNFHRIARLRRFAAAAGTALALLLVTGAPAHAASTGTLTDNFESTDAGFVWTNEMGVPLEGLVEYSSTAHSPTHQAFALWPPAGGWSSIERRVYLPVSVLNSTSRCSASIWVRPIGITKFNIEVINPSDYTYISLKTVTIGTASGYFPFQQLTVPTWTPRNRNILFRVSLVDIGTDTLGAQVDDLRVTCNWV
jgi:hypothetical protein